MASRTETLHGFFPQPAARTGSTDGLSRAYLADEAGVMERVLGEADAGPAARARIEERAAGLVRSVREQESAGGIDAFLQQYDLSSQEGVVLMCIAEALLRIPDADTADSLIADKLSAGRWDDHLGTSESVFVNASTWGLMLTGRLLALDDSTVDKPGRVLGRLVSRAGEPVVRAAMRQAMKIMGHQFVMGRTIDEALERGGSRKGSRYRYSFDMLGEAALTRRDAERYFAAYENAIDRIGAARDATHGIYAAPSISVKLSALHPRYEYAQRERVIPELGERLLALAERARGREIALTVDAEEADRLELSLEVFAEVIGADSLQGYDGLGLALQAYQKRVLDVVGWLGERAREHGKRIPVRLVKGAYWDTEIKHAQELGLAGYPVFTRKVNTDVSYLAAARALLASPERFYPQFATHNAHTIASVMEFAGDGTEFEFQRLHGMGESLYDAVIGEKGEGRPCRVYAPVGQHKDLLPYLVRRLLENGANTSFVNRISDEREPVEAIVADPIEIVRRLDSVAHPRIVLPPNLFGPARRNSAGWNLADRAELAGLLKAMDASASAGPRSAAPVVAGERLAGERQVSVNPAATSEVIGHVEFAAESTVGRALDVGSAAAGGWANTPVERRAELMRVTADLFEAHSAELLSLCILEAGKTLPRCHRRAARGGRLPALLRR